MSMMNIGRVKSNRRADEKGRRFALTYIQLSCSLSLLARPVSQLSIVSSASFPLPTLQWFCASSLSVNRRKVRLESYGPKFVENIVQATARDILAEAMLRLDAAGYTHLVRRHLVTGVLPANEYEAVAPGSEEHSRYPSHPRRGNNR